MHECYLCAITQMLPTMGFIIVHNKGFFNCASEEVGMGTSKCTLTTQNVGMSKHALTKENTQCVKLIFYLDCGNCSYRHLLCFYKTCHRKLQTRTGNEKT